MKINLTELLADREAGTDGPWNIRAVSKDMKIVGNIHQVTDEAGYPAAFIPAWDDPGPGEIDGTEEALANARRIASLPDLESAYIEAVEVLRKIASARSAMDGGSINECRAIARKFLGDGE